MRGFDIWVNDRAKAVNEGGLLVLRDDSVRPVVKLWRGKQSKPFANYYFSSIENREKFIAGQIEHYKRYSEFKAEQKAKKKPTQDQLNSIKVGDIFSMSWGYDQTNVDFFQVVEKSGFFVKIRGLAQEAVHGSEGFMSERVIPIPAKYISEPMRKRLSFYNGNASIKVGHQHASPWDGSPKYASHYA